MRSSTFNQFFPLEIFRDKDDACPIGASYVNAAPSTTVQLVPAVTGKILRIVSLWAYTDGAGSNECGIITNASTLGAILVPGNTSPMLKLDFSPAGWFDSQAGFNISISTSAGTNVRCSVRYIVYSV